MLWHIKVLHQVWTSVAPICKLLGSRILSIPIMESFCEHTSESTLPTWVLYYIELFIPWRKKQLPHVKHEMRFLMVILTALLCYLSTLKSVSNLKQRLSHILLVKPKLWYNVWMPHFLKRICGLWLFAHFLLQIPKYSSDDHLMIWTTVLLMSLFNHIDIVVSLFTFLPNTSHDGQFMNILLEFTRLSQLGLTFELLITWSIFRRNSCCFTFYPRKGNFSQIIFQFSYF
jgi:hypothetical protein